MKNLLKLGVCFIALFVPALCHAQSGVVKSGDLPIPGATVKATQGERILLTVSDANGAFDFEGMSAGTWIVEVDMFGFDHARKEVQVGATPAKIDFALQLRDRARPAAGGRGGSGNPGTDDLGGDLSTAQINNAGLPDIAQPQGADASASNESLQLLGSVSQGSQTTGADLRGFGPGGFGGGPGGLGDPNFQGGPGGPGGPGGAPGARGGPGGRAAGGGGFGGGGGGGRGGGGFGGGGGRGGGRGGRGGPRDRNGNPAFIGNRQRSQQNRITGSLFYTFGNSAVNARPFSVNGIEEPKAAYAQNRFGFSAGGPLFIPKLFSAPKIFWFVNYTGNLTKNGVDQAYNEPTLAERGGNFSSLLTGSNPTILYYPQSGPCAGSGPIPGNIIPGNCISSIAQGLLKYVPLPNQNNGSVNQDFRLIVANPNNAQNLNTRFNTTLTPKDTLAVTFNFQSRDTNTSEVYGCCDALHGQGLNTNVNWRHRFGARMFNNLTLLFNRNTNITTPFFANGTNVAADLGIAGTSPSAVNYGPPTLTFANYSSLNDTNTSRSAVWSYGANDTLQIRRGKNNWSLGGGLTHYLNNTITDSNGRGTFNFSGLSTSGYTSAGLPISGTGYDFADFLLGLPETSSIRYGNSSTYFRSNGFNAFAVDDWRVATNLSLNLGLRWEYFTPWHEEYGHIANLDIAPGFAAVAPVLPGQAGPLSGVVFPNSLINSDKNNFSPRIALAWKPWTKGKTLVRAGYGWYYNPSQYNRFESQLGAEPPFAMTNNITTSTTNPLTLANGLVAVPVGQSVTNSYAVALNYRDAYSQSWNVGIQQDLPSRLVGEITYVGIKGTHLDLEEGPNQAPLGSVLTAEQRLPIANASNFEFDTPSGDSIYHALQARLTRRFQKGVSANLLYTFSKSIDDVAIAQNFYDQAAERALSAADHRNALTANWVLASPVDATRGFLSHPVWLAKGLKDWTLSGSLTAQSGAPLSPTIIGDRDGTASTIAPLRADATGLPVNSGSGYFNLAAFTVPAAGTYGNAGRNTIEGPGLFVANFSLARSINLKSEQRRLEFRVDSTNTLNHVSPAGLITTVNSSQYGLITSAATMRQITATLRLRF